MVPRVGQSNQQSYIVVFIQGVDCARIMDDQGKHTADTVLGMFYIEYMECSILE